MAREGLVAPDDGSPEGMAQEGGASPSDTGGRVLKVRFVGQDSGTVTDLPESQQLPDDPFQQMYGAVSLQQPPFNLDQLQMLAEQHPTHGAALAQKTADVVGKELEFVAINKDAKDEQRDEIKEWLESLTSNDRTFLELLTVTWRDYETTAQGYWEVARDNKGVVGKLWHIPAHTVRVHSDHDRYVQQRRGRMVWFKRWGGNLDHNILAANGNKAPGNTGTEKVANEILPFVVPTSRNSWYGIPGYVGAIGWITMSLAARDYNIMFFSNNREPRWMMIVSGLSEEHVDQTLEEITQALLTQHGPGAPHRNMLVPTTKGVDIRIERLTSVANDLHFVRLLDVSDTYIAGGHRMPSERIGIVRRGPLGGTATRDSNLIYKDAVVGPSQGLYADRLNRFILVEFALAKGIDPDTILWRVAFSALDIRDEEVEVAIIVEELKAQIMTLNEARVLRGRDTKDGWDVTLAEWMAKHGGSVANFAMEAGQVNGQAKLIRALGGLGARMDALDEVLEELVITREEP